MSLCQLLLLLPLFVILSSCVEQNNSIVRFDNLVGVNTNSGVKEDQRIKQKIAVSLGYEVMELFNLIRYNKYDEFMLDYRINGIEASSGNFGFNNQELFKSLRVNSDKHQEYSNLRTFLDRYMEAQYQYKNYYVMGLDFSIIFGDCNSKDPLTNHYKKDLYQKLQETGNKKLSRKLRRQTDKDKECEAYLEIFRELKIKR